MDFRGMERLKSALISRLTCALSYSAYDLIRASAPGALLTGLVPLFACGAVVCKRIEGLQILLAILAAQGLASLMPIPHEPSSAAIIPNVLLHFAVFSIVRTRLLINDNVSDQFMALSLNARAFAYFKTSDQITEAAVMSIAYLVVTRLPISSFSGSSSAKTVVDCFATRSAALWVASFFETEALLVLLLIISADGGVTAIMELTCAQRIVSSASGDGVIVLLVILLFFTQRLGGVATCGLSMLATRRLEGWIKEWSHAEAALAYMSAFCVLQMCKSKRREHAHVVVIAHEAAEEFLLMLQF
jgi:hypothetical protein